MTEITTGIFLLLGGGFMVTASLGIAKFPDLFTRMQATTKASSLSVGLILIGVAVDFPTPDIIVRAIGIILFIFLTAPVGAHLIARVGYLLKTPFWEGTLFDDLKNYYGKSQPEKNVKAKTAGGAKIHEIFKKLRDKKL